jgi:hypothetical protein
MMNIKKKIKNLELAGISNARIKRFFGKRQKKISNFVKTFGKQKIFCIGLNKTGTTSLRFEMEDLGFAVGNQRKAELLFDDWVKRDFRKLRRYCHTAQFFQDAPFSYPYTFIALDQFFPNSKFILTVRDDAEQWYSSLTRFHGKKWGNGNVSPTAEDLKNATYIYKGFPYHSRMHVHPVTDENPYDKDILTDYYETHNKNVKDYFRHRPDDLLVINLAKEGDYARFCKFIGVEKKKDNFPWKNKT